MKTALTEKGMWGFFVWGGGGGGGGFATQDR